MREELDLIRNSVSRLFKENAEKKILDQAEQGKFPKNLWKTIKNAGYHEAWYGTGTDNLKIALVIAQESGRYSIPLPIVETMIARKLTHECEIDLAEDIVTISNPQLYDNLDLRNNILSGNVKGVPFGRFASKVVLSINEKLIIAPVTNTHMATNMAGEARDELSWNDCEIFVGDTLHPNEILLYGALMRTAQICGSLQHALEMSINYSTEREQFGRPLHKFQSIQNYLAKIASSKSIADSALLRATENPSESNIAAAKACASEAAGEVAALSHRIHGAIGFTYEYSLHHITRRLLSWREEFGAETWWHKNLGEIVVDRGPDKLWDLIVS